MTSEEEQGGVMIEAEERDMNQERLGPDSPGASRRHCPNHTSDPGFRHLASGTTGEKRVLFRLLRLL